MDCPPSWRITPYLNIEIKTWPDGGIVFNRESGDTHWVPEAACLVLQELASGALSHDQLRQKLAIRLEMADDDVDLNKILDVACDVLSKAALIEPANPAPH